MRLIPAIPTGPARGIVCLVVAMTLNPLVTRSAAADSRSDNFQPDVFGTGAALKKRTPGLTHLLDLPGRLRTSRPRRWAVPRAPGSLAYR
jgi:hypothetical protein